MNLLVNKKLIIVIFIFTTVTVLLGIILLRNYFIVREQEIVVSLDKIKTNEAGTSKKINIQEESPLLSIEQITNLGTKGYSTRLADGSKVYALDQQDILNSNLQEYYKQSGISCNIIKCLIVDVDGDAIIANQQVTYLSSFSLKGNYYWVSVWFENDQYTLQVSKARFSEPKEFTFDKKVKNIIEIGIEKGIFEIQYLDGTTENLELKIKI